MEKLQNIISAEGYSEDYTNGKNQQGQKQTTAVKTYIAITKNQAIIIKQLCDLVPPEKRKKSKLEALLAE